MVGCYMTKVRLRKEVSESGFSGLKNFSELVFDGLSILAFTIKLKSSTISFCSF